MTKYELFLCDVSGKHRPVAKFKSEFPFHSFSVCERFDDHGWDRLDGVGVLASIETPKRYVVDSIKHTIFKNGGRFIRSMLVKFVALRG